MVRGVAEYADMTDNQIRKSLETFDAFVKSERENNEKLREAGVDEWMIRMYSIPSRSYEMADRMEEELRRREQKNEKHD
jgi:hypothetical protein